MFKDGESYYPSNGTEGTIFQSDYCDACSKDRWNGASGKQCSILVKALCIGERVPEWVYINGVPTCTKFKSKEESNREARERRRNKPNIKQAPGQMSLFS